ncbi:MAG TPA: adenylate/guanylate cyclase domain-containing protein [Candidatus Ozemobacteraceae bacterium]|nr:adenylate/guanylate cyclase domain-containing protein [Candidatus Ozemobacteraceae bacterium]
MNGPHRTTSAAGRRKPGIREMIGLWLFLVVIPLAVFRSFYLGEIARQAEERLMQARQDCVTQMQDFQADLGASEILHELLQQKNIDPWAPSRNWPWLASFDPKTLTRGESVLRLRRKIFELTGIPPAYVLVMGAESQNAYLTPALRGRVDTGVLKAAMREYFLFYSSRFGMEFLRQLLVGKPPSCRWSDGVIRSLLDIPSSMEEWYAKAFPAYSLLHQSSCFIINIPVFSAGSGQMDALIQVSFLDKDMRPGVILRKIGHRRTTKGERLFGMRSAHGLPRFERENGDLIYLDLAPGRILNLTRWNPELVDLIEKGRLPVLGIRIRSDELTVLSPDGRSLLDIVLGIAGLLGLFVLSRLMSPELPLSTGIGTKVTLVFLLGAVVPLVGIGWMGRAFLRSEHDLKAEETLDVMTLELERLDRFMRASALRAEKRLRSVQRALWRNTRDATHGEAWVRSLKSAQVMVGMQWFRNDGEERFVWGGNKNSLMKRIGDFLRGPLAETMCARGAFSQLDRKTQEKIQNAIAISLSVLEKNFDMKYFGELFANPGCLFENPVSGTFQKLVMLGGGSAGVPPKIAAIGVLEPHMPFVPFFRILERHPRLLCREKNGFKIYIHVYRIPTKTSETVNLEWPTFTVPFVELAESRKWLANSFLASRTNGRMNNMRGATPYLAAGRMMGMGAYLAMAYAEPLDELPGGFTRTWGLALVLCALFLAVLIARATTWFLTRPMASFIEAIQATSRGSLSWRVQTETLDEFGELGDSLNRMAEGLQEKERMSRLVSEDVLQVVARDDDSGIRPGGQRVEATILFSDIRGFTTISETHPPEQVVLMLNGYFTKMARCIKDHHGVLDKFIGDAIQAVFYPREGEEPSAVRACRAAFAMREALDEFNRDRAKQGLFTVQTGIGLACGQVVAGCIGSSRGRLDYTVIGRTLQVAMKLEAESKKARTTGIMIEPVTIRSAAGKIRFGYIERMELESGTRSVPVYELLGMRNEKPESPDVG